MLAAGMVTLTNHNPDLSDQDICRMLQAEYGDVYSIMTPQDNPHKRHIEFCDVRHAQAAKQVLEGIAAKIPTISEVRCSPFAVHFLHACVNSLKDKLFLKYLRQPVSP